MSDKLNNFRYEKELRAALKQIVRDRLDLIAVIQAAGIPEDDYMEFSVILGDTLGDLDAHNYADHGLSEEETIAWIEAGRPAGSLPSAPDQDYSEDPGAVIPYRKT